MNTCIIYVIKYNIIIACMKIFQNKCTHVVTSFSYYNFKISSAYEPSWHYQLPFYELYISYIYLTFIEP